MVNDPHAPGLALPAPAWAAEWPFPAESIRLRPLAEAPADAVAMDPELLHGRYRVEADGSVEFFLTDEPRAPWSALRLAWMVGTWRAQGLVLHATALLRERDGVAVLGLGVSGAGKSTLTTLAEGFTSLSDESPHVVLGADGAVHVHGTPFQSSSPKAPRPLRAPLRALLLLEKSAPPDFVPAFTPVDAEAGLRALLAQTYRPPPQVKGAAGVLARVSGVARSVPAYRFTFPKSAEAGLLLHRLCDGLPR